MRGIKKRKLLEIFTIPEWLGFFELFLLRGRQLNDLLNNQTHDTNLGKYKNTPFGL